MNKLIFILLISLSLSSYLEQWKPKDISTLPIDMVENIYQQFLNIVNANTSNSFEIKSIDTLVCQTTNNKHCKMAITVYNDQKVAAFAVEFYQIDDLIAKVTDVQENKYMSLYMQKRTNKLRTAITI